jgi:hypothetical protein
MIILDKERYVKAGAWYQFEGIKEQGMRKFKDALDSNPELLEKLRNYNGN